MKTKFFVLGLAMTMCGTLAVQLDSNGDAQPMPGDGPAGQGTMTFVIKKEQSTPRPPHEKKDYAPPSVIARVGCAMYDYLADMVNKKIWPEAKGEGE